jgi:hypothetical protein
MQPLCLTEWERRPGAMRLLNDPSCLIDRPIAARAQLLHPIQSLCLIEWQVPHLPNFVRSWWERRLGAMRPLNSPILTGP